MAKNYTGKVEEILPPIVDDLVKLNLGSVRFFKKDKKTEGKLYFRSGLAYGIELSTYKPNIVNRIITNEYVKDNAREFILQRYGDNLNDMGVVQFVLTAQLFPEKPLLLYIKDYFLDAFDELLTWDQTTAEWKAGDEPKNPSVPNTNPFELIEKAKKRREYLESKISPEWNATIKQMESLGFRRNFRFESSDYATSVLLSVADGNWTIGAAAEYLGMSRFNVKKTLFELWQEGIIDVIHPSGLLITNRTQDSLRNGQNKTQGGVNLGINRELELMPGDTIEALPVPPRPTQMIQSSPQAQQVPQPSQPQQVQASNPIASQPVILQEPSAVASQPIPTQIQTAPAQPVQPETIQSSQPLQALPQSEPQQIRNQQMSDPNQSGTSRLAVIAQQLREELANMDKAIQSAVDRKNTLVQYAASLQNEKNALIAQLQSVDTRLATNNTDIANADAEINHLASERAETTKLLQG